MDLRKVCLQCNTILQARRSVCGSAHAFRLKRKAQCIANKEKSQVMKRKRTLESELETLLRRETDKVNMRASETCEETLNRQEQNRMHMASMRTSEKYEETLHIIHALLTQKYALI